MQRSLPLKDELRSCRGFQDAALTQAEGELGLEVEAGKARHDWIVIV